MTGYAIGVDDILAAHERIRPQVCISPLKRLDRVSAITGRDIWMKLETTQPTGSFKIRGAVNTLLTNVDQARSFGVVTFSTGNHGRAMAFAARELGIQCTVFLSHGVPQGRRDRIADLGAEVKVVGTGQDDAEIAAMEFAAAAGGLLVSPVNHRDVIAGQGTIAIELLTQMPEVRTVIIPLSGGGLAAGVSLYLRTQRPSIRLIGVTMDRGAAMYESLRAGYPMQVDEVPSLAESLQGGIGGPNSITFPIVRDCLDEAMLTSEQSIAVGLLLMHRLEKVAVEGASAAAVGLLLDRREINLPVPICLLGTGGDIAAEDVDALLEIPDVAARFSGVENH